MHIYAHTSSKTKCEEDLVYLIIKKDPLKENCHAENEKHGVASYIWFVSCVILAFIAFQGIFGLKEIVPW